jgi:cytochrome c oxidase subunit 4
MNSPPPLRVYAVTWVSLMALLTATFVLAHFRLGAWNPALAMAIAAAKAVLVALFFMHLRRSSVLVILFSLVALFALSILFGLSGTDYLTRTIHPAPWMSPYAPSVAPAQPAPAGFRPGAGAQFPEHP